MANSFQNELESPDLASVSELAENIIYRLPGCSDLMVRKTIREVFREFCRETKCLTFECVIELEDGLKHYHAFPMFSGVVTEILSVRIDGRLLKRGFDYAVLDDGCVRLSDANVWEAPSRNEPSAESYDKPPKMIVKAVEIPRLESEKTPRWFIEKYGDAIVNGVLARLMSMTGRAWTDSAKATEARIIYENFKSEFRMRQEFSQSGKCIDTSDTL